MIELWIPITIFAAFCQNLRSAVQKHLKGELSNAGATFSRFGYGLPVVFAYVLALRYGAGMAWPEPNPEFVIYGLIGGATQIGATFLLVWMFSCRDFSVGRTYSKTETGQAARVRVGRGRPHFRPPSPCPKKSRRPGGPPGGVPPIPKAGGAPATPGVPADLAWEFIYLRH